MRDLFRRLRGVLVAILCATLLFSASGVVEGSGDQQGQGRQRPRRPRVIGHIPYPGSQPMEMSLTEWVRPALRILRRFKGIVHSEESLVNIMEQAEFYGPMQANLFLHGALARLRRGQKDAARVYFNRAMDELMAAGANQIHLFGFSQGAVVLMRVVAELQGEYPEYGGVPLFKIPIRMFLFHSPTGLGTSPQRHLASFNSAFAGTDTGVLFFSGGDSATEILHGIGNAVDRFRGEPAAPLYKAAVIGMPRRRFHLITNVEAMVDDVLAQAPGLSDAIGDPLATNAIGGDFRFPWSTAWVGGRVRHTGAVDLGQLGRIFGSE